MTVWWSCRCEVGTLLVWCLVFSVLHGILMLHASTKKILSLSNIDNVDCLSFILPEVDVVELLLWGVRCEVCGVWGRRTWWYHRFYVGIWVGMHPWIHIVSRTVHISTLCIRFDSITMCWFLFRVLCGNIVGLIVRLNFGCGFICAINNWTEWLHQDVLSYFRSLPFDISNFWSCTNKCGVCDWRTCGCTTCSFVSLYMFYNTFVVLVPSSVVLVWSVSLSYILTCRKVVWLHMLVVAGLSPVSIVGDDVCTGSCDELWCITF